MTVGRTSAGPGSGFVTVRAYTVDGTEIVDSSVSPPNDGNIATPVSVHALGPEISRIEVDGTGAGYAIDDLTFDVPATPPPPDFGLAWPGRSAGQVPIGPGSSVDVPLAISRVNGSSGPITFSAADLPAGVTATFLPNPATDTATHSGVTMRLQAASLAALAPVVKQEVAVTASPVPAAGVTSREVIVPVTVLAQFDLRARGLEITQGIQSGGPGQGLPQVALGPYVNSYRGVTLLAGGFKATIVRFYADASGAPTGGASADATLTGFRDGKPLPDSPLHPDVHPSPLTDLGGGTAVSYAERVDDLHSFNFTLPPSWVHGDVTLHAHVFVPPSFGFGATQQECGQPFCLGNNDVELRDITFVSPEVVNLDPVKIVYDDRTRSGSPHIEPPDPFAPFDVANRVDPVRIVPRYWRGTIDVTTHKVFKGFKGWVTRSFIADNTISRSDRGSEILDDLEDWADDYADVSYPVGVIGYIKQFDGSTTDMGQTTGGPLNSGTPMSVVNPQRPYTSVAHELGHGFGRPHASGGCGGGSNGQAAEPWPDPFGYIEGVGVIAGQPASDGGEFTTLGGNIGATNCTTNPADCGAGSPAQPFDYMSYCARENNSWISPIGWNEIASRYNRGPIARDPGAGPAPATIGVIAGARRPGVRVRGFVTASGGHLGLVALGSFPAVRAAAASPVQLIATDAAGHALASGPLKVTFGHADGPDGPRPVMLFEGSVAAPGAKSVRIVENGTELARRDRTAHAPRASFISPRAGDVVGRSGSVVVRWRASDADHTPVTTMLDYSSDAGRTFHRVYLGGNAGHVALPRQYFAHGQRARLRLTADDGFNQTVVLSGVFRSLGAPPIVHIATPIRGTVRDQDATLDLTGYGFDDSGNRLTGRSLSWFEGRRLLGRGETVGVTGLASGLQRLRLVARDRSGRSSEASVSVRLLPVVPAFLALTAPHSVSKRATRLTLRIASSVETRVSIAGQSFPVDRAARSVEVKIKPGTRRLRLRVVLGSGRFSISRTLSVTR